MDDNQKEEKQKGSNPIGAVVTGAVVGAGVVAVQTVLKSEENRKKLHDAVDMAKDKAGEYATSLKDTVMSEKHVKKFLPQEKKVAKKVKMIGKKVATSKNKRAK